MRIRVKGAGNLERFDYWLESFKYMRAIGRLKCSWGEYEAALKVAGSEKDPGRRKAMLAARALPKRLEMIARLSDVYRSLIATIGTTGELGTLANWERHILPTVIVKPGEELERMLGQKLPAAAWPPNGYAGPTRVILPTRPSFYTRSDPLRIKVMVLSERPIREAAIRFRAIGEKRYTRAALRHVRRGVYEAELDASAFRGTDIEYYVTVVDGSGARVRYPATAPEINLTLVPFD